MIRASGILLALFFAATTWLVATAPTDSMQGAIQKILYVHVPCAFAAYAGFIVTGVSGALYLWRRDERFDWWALAGAEVGVVFCTLNIASGPIWARGTWGPSPIGSFETLSKKLMAKKWFWALGA